jgi:hypothetical protein
MAGIEDMDDVKNAVEEIQRGEDPSDDPDFHLTQGPDGARLFFPVVVGYISHDTFHDFTHDIFYANDLLLALTYRVFSVLSYSTPAVEAFSL